MPPATKLNKGKKRASVIPNTEGAHALARQILHLTDGLEPKDGAETQDLVEWAQSFCNGVPWFLNLT
ncbi:hypothetical protein EVJ58_g5175 [Rhodofomes roseus]|uniref:Uncharacterized protein n=1 Tax=Rhodofomes roseus TaxID=34475 RepID=A0A4Y9YEX9_9APHY|nr:hypothetical protein EVJ58_g5175 [Rhodofomes roseus]